MSRSVDNIYFVAFIVDGNILGKNSYTSFTLKVVVVENELAGVLIFAEKVPGEEHFVNESCLSVVNVRYDSDVANFLHTLLEFIFGCKGSDFSRFITYPQH